MVSQQDYDQIKDAVFEVSGIFTPIPTALRKIFGVLMLRSSQGLVDADMADLGIDEMAQLTLEVDQLTLEVSKYRQDLQKSGDNLEVADGALFDYFYHTMLEHERAGVRRDKCRSFEFKEVSGLTDAALEESLCILGESRYLSGGRSDDGTYTVMLQEHGIFEHAQCVHRTEVCGLLELVIEQFKSEESVWSYKLAKAQGLSHILVLSILGECQGHWGGFNDMTSGYLISSPPSASLKRKVRGLRERINREMGTGASSSPETG